MQMKITGGHILQRDGSGCSYCNTTYLFSNAVQNSTRQGTSAVFIKYYIMKSNDDDEAH